MSTPPVALELGFDQFEANLIVSACRDAGLRVEPLIMDGAGHGSGQSTGTAHRLLVDADDADAARLIIDDFRGS